MPSGTFPKPPVTQSQKRKVVGGILLTAFALGAATFCLFLPTLRSGFVCDAVIIVLQQPFIHDPSNWWNLLTLRVVSMDVIDFNRPVHLASLMLDAALWGRDPFGYHLTSNLLHAANTALVFFVILRTLISETKSSSADSPSWKKISAAAFGALLFAWHPVQCEAVCEPTFREDSQVVFFSLTALLLAIGGGGVAASASLEKKPLPPAWMRVAACWVLCFLAVGSKESGLAAPGILAAWGILFAPRPRWRYWATLVAGAFVLSASFLAFRFALEKPDSMVFSVKPTQLGGSMASSLLVFPRILTAYLGNFLDPSRLSADYTFDSLAAPGITESWVVFLVLLAAIAACAWRSRPVAFGLCLFAIPLLFVSNVVPIYSPMADRHFYFPMAGLGMLAAAGFGALLRSGNVFLNRFTVAVALALCLALAFGTFERQKAWASPEALFLDTIAKNPRSFAAHGVYATALSTAGDKEKALHHTLEAIRLMPDGGQNLRLDAAKLLVELGRKEEAAAILRPVEIPPGEASAQRHRLLETAMLQDFVGNTDAARAAYFLYLAVVSDDARALNNLAWILATDSGGSVADRKEAVSLARRAVAIDPAAHRNQGTLAVALLENGDAEEGRTQAEKAHAMARAAGDSESAALVEAWVKKSTRPGE